MNRLTKLANKYSTDKGTEYMYKHTFTEFYEPYLKKFEHPTILEIGTGDGGSAKMFSAYYDGDCEIYTLDILPIADKFEGYNNIHTYVVDASNEDSVWGFIESLNGLKFDIIIDDASHRYKDQYISLVYFRQCLKKGGLFIMEDLHTSYANIPDIAFEDRPLGFLTNGISMMREPIKN